MSNVVAMVILTPEEDEELNVAVAPAWAEAMRAGKTEAEARQFVADARQALKDRIVAERGNIKAIAKRRKELAKASEEATEAIAAPVVPVKPVKQKRPVPGAVTPTPATLPAPIVTPSSPVIPPVPPDLLTKPQKDAVDKWTIARRQGKATKPSKKVKDHLTEDRMKELMADSGIIFDDLPLSRDGHARRLLAMDEVTGRIKFVVKPNGGNWIIYDENTGTWSTAAAPQTIGNLITKLAYVMLEWAKLAEEKATDAYYTADEQAEFAMLINRLRSEHHRILGGIAGIRTQASYHSSCHVRVEAFDPDPFKLAVANGVLNLHTGRLSKHSPDHYITKALPIDYDPKATCPQWEAFTHQVIPDRETYEFVQRHAGSCLTGDVEEGVGIWFWGPGGTGKSSFWKGVRRVIGPWAASAQRGIFHASEASRFASASIIGKRLIVDSEFDDHERLNTGRYRQLTGEDEHSPEPKMQRLIDSAAITAKFVFIVNSPVSFDHRDANVVSAILRRTYIVPMNETVIGVGGAYDTNGYRELQGKFHAEREGILAWLVKGCMAWRKQGLHVNEPKLMQRTRDEYMEKLGLVIIDPIEEALTKAGYQLDPTQKTLASELNAAMPPSISATALGRWLTEKGCVSKKSGSRYWVGIGT